MRTETELVRVVNPIAVDVGRLHPYAGCMSAYSTYREHYFHSHRGQRSMRWRIPVAGVLSDGGDCIATVRYQRGMIIS